MPSSAASPRDTRVIALIRQTLGGNLPVKILAHLLGTEHLADERELKALSGLRVAVAAIEGIGSDELVPLLTRSAELCRRLCRDSELAEALRATAFHHMYAGDMAQAAALGWEALDIATRANDPPQVALSYNALGSAHHWMGHFAASRAELEKALSFDRPHDGARKNVDAAAGALIVALLLLSRDLGCWGFRISRGYEDGNAWR